jgi:hypothetical protein
VDLLTGVANGSEYASGAWPRDHMNGASGNGTFKFSWTLTNTSQPDWGAFAALAQGGVWRTNSGTIEGYDTADNQMFARAVTNAAGATVDIKVDNLVGMLTLAGFLTGNGAFAYTPAAMFPAGTLKIGGIAGQSGWGILGTPSATWTDGVATAGSGGTSAGAATTAAVGAALAASPGAAAAAATTAGVGAALASSGGTAAGVATAVADNGTTASSGGTSSGAATAAAVGAALAASPGAAAGAATTAAVGAALASSGGSAAGVATALMSAVSGFGLGAYGAQRVTYGTAAGTVTVTLATQPSGSAFLVGVGGNLSDLATTVTDTEGNVWVERGSFEFTQWAGYGCVYYQCVGGTGDASHGFAQQFGQTLGFDEATIAAVEIKQAAWVEDFGSGETSSGSAVPTPAVDAQSEAEWIVMATGDAPTGTTAAYSPSNGLAVIHDTTGIDDPDGYVPMVLLRRRVSAPGTYQSTIGITPAQRIGFGAWTVQELHAVGSGGATAGAATTAAVGAALAASPGAAAAAATTAGVGAALASSGGTAAGVATSSGAAISAAATGGAAAGAATTAGVGAALASSPGTSSGAASVAGVGAALASSGGAAAGTSTAEMTTPAGSGGVASGGATVVGDGLAAWASPGSSAGAATAAAVGAALASSGGTAAGGSSTSSGPAVVRRLQRPIEVSQTDNRLTLVEEP